MRTIEYKVSYENMISRLPGLFAYLDVDDFGNMQLYNANYSNDGCYGKIVENIKLPDDCSCYVPFYEKRYSVFCFVNKSDSSDIIPVYVYDNLSDEEIMNYKEYDYPKIINESEFEDVEEENKMYFSLKYIDKRNYVDYISVEDYENMARKGGETYTFRTLITFYYDYKDYLSEDDNFKKFIEKGIGKIKVGDISYFEYSDDNEKFKLLSEVKALPKFLYLSNVRNLYNEMMKMKKTCSFYERVLENNEINQELCCICEKFKDFGGDLFVEYLEKLTHVSKEIADEYITYADKNNSMKLELSIDLLSSYNDIGIMTPYAPQWIPYKKYFKGDKVVYDDKLYICIAEEGTSGKWLEEYERIVFDDVNFVLYDGAFVNMKLTETYETEIIDGEEEIVDIIENLNFIEKQITSVGEIWYDGSATKHIAQSYDIGKTVKDYNVLLSNETLDEPFIIRGQTDSKLISLRRFATYYNADYVAELPQKGYDWLFYYRKGNILNIRTINDELGNVKCLNKNETATSKDDTLAAFGDFIQDIVIYEEGREIIFIYYIGVHLKSEEDPEVKKDDDGNSLYKWDKFVWDGDENFGIKYQEVYNYREGSDLDNLINNKFRDIISNITVSFDDYINGRYDVALQDYKFEFSVKDENEKNYKKIIANQEVSINSALTDFEIKRTNYFEFEEAALFREDYLNGITYNPTRDIDVKIERGSTSCFEKCISLSEIKTLEDLENFQNGSFFNIMST